LTPKRSVPFVDEQVARTPAPTEPTPAQPQPPRPQSPPQPPQTAQGPKRPFDVVDASEGFLSIRNGPGTTYQEIAKMPLGANGLVGHCVRLQGGWKPFCEVDWQGWSGWASSCCMAELGEQTQFSYRVNQKGPALLCMEALCPDIRPRTGAFACRTTLLRICSISVSWACA